ncbi:MAG: RDD family protein [Candidatus Nanohaloarchaea archaeon]|nr:RDD family protein [Candidatus Nanohaloarchaea archaeon]
MAEEIAKFQPKEKKTPYVGFGDRFVAYLVDTVLSSITLGLYWFYWLYATAAYGDSVGKRMMDIVIVDSQGNRNLGFGKMLMRELVGRFVDNLVFGIGALWMLIDSEKQALHDKVARTYVIHTDAL